MDYLPSVRGVENLPSQAAPSIHKGQVTSHFRVPDTIELDARPDEGWLLKTSMSTKDKEASWRLRSLFKD